MKPMNYALLPGFIRSPHQVYEYVRGLVSPNPCNSFYWSINETLRGRTPFQEFHDVIRPQMREEVR